MQNKTIKHKNTMHCVPIQLNTNEHNTTPTDTKQNKLNNTIQAIQWHAMQYNIILMYSVQIQTQQPQPYNTTQFICNPKQFKFKL